MLRNIENRVAVPLCIYGVTAIWCFTADLEKILTEQLAIHQKLKAAGTICPFVFHRNGERIGYVRSAWWNACKAAGCPDALVHDMRRSAVRTFERAGVPRSVAMSIVGHKRSPSIAGMPSWMRPCSGRRRHASMPGWLPLRQHHRRPPSLLSVEVVDSGAASRGESGHSTPAGRGLMLTAALSRVTPCRSAASGTHDLVNWLGARARSSAAAAG
jgi:hypothetical protein